MTSTRLDRDFSQLPSEREAVEGFLQLMNLDLSSKSYSEVLSLFFDQISFLPTMPVPCYSETPETVFRARRCAAAPDDPALLSYPPNAMARKGRLNIDGYPVFYSSDKPLISILELNPTAGEEFYIGIWRVRDFNNVLICPLLVDYRGWVSVLLKQKQLLLSAIKKLNAGVRERYLNVYRLVTELVMGNNIDLSSVLGHFLLNDMTPNPAEIIIYPSVKANRQHANFAFSTRIVDSKFQFVGGVCLRVLGIAPNQQSGRFLFLKEATSTFRGIAWEDCRPSHEMELAVGSPPDVSRGLNRADAYLPIDTDALAARWRVPMVRRSFLR